MQESGISLIELNARVKNMISKAFSEDFWVFGEISDIHTNSTGHCYLELVEKDQETDRIIAKIRANIWAYTFRLLRPYFENTTGYRLSSGIKILFKAGVEFHEVFGLSLNIKDINPEYTLGDIARKKKEIIRRLTAEGIVDMNKMLEIPLVPQRIAVISSETAAGYGDFMKSLSEMTNDFTLKVVLFPAIMQGDKTEESIVAALEQIFQREDEFDVVVVIRGGGSQSDLESFNNYNIAFHIAQFPLPVITGIGHDRDETIIDMVANTSLKTPTAVAGFISDQIYEFIERLNDSQSKMEAFVEDIISRENYYMESYSLRLKTLANNRMLAEDSLLSAKVKDIQMRTSYLLSAQNNKINNYFSSMSKFTFSFIRSGEEKISGFNEEISRVSKGYFQKKTEILDSHEKIVRLMDPVEVLRRGFSLTSFKGKVLKDLSGIKEGYVIKTRLLKGEIESVINKTKKS